MSVKPKIDIVRIPISREKPLGEGDDGIILLYDESKQCYYRATMSHVLNCVMRKQTKFEQEQTTKYTALERELMARCDALERKLTAQQNKFIADTAKMNESIIELVKKSLGDSDK